jgi:predicted nucleotidyltransferase
MRLTTTQIEQIKTLVAGHLGPEAEVRLFGSRVDDQIRGGDVDLLVASSNAVERPALLSATLAARISRVLRGRKVDVVIDAPNLTRLPIHAVAMSQGIRL